MLRKFRDQSIEIANLHSRRELSSLMAEANETRAKQFGKVISYSPKVFIPLTRLCRDTCRYCTFAQSPRKNMPAYMTAQQVIDIVQEGQSNGCYEALLTLGDRPESRWPQARTQLEEMGFSSTLSYVVHIAREIRDRTEAEVHVNPGVMSRDEILELREVASSLGIMLEGIAPHLTERGGAHLGCPDKLPHLRLDTIRAAGESQVAMTTGLLIGLGESRAERVEALLELAAIDHEFGNIQEIIIQPFRPKPGTPMSNTAAADDIELLWTIAVARLMVRSSLSIQSPPNLSPHLIEQMVGAGTNDLGGISPVTVDHVNPEAAWPHLDRLTDRLKANGQELRPRLPLYPEYARNASEWTGSKAASRVLSKIDGSGWPRTDEWISGKTTHIPAWAESQTITISANGENDQALRKLRKGEDISNEQISQLFNARGKDFENICATANELREILVGDTVTYVSTRNINYTNVCTYKCGFCAFSKGRIRPDIREKPYTVSLEEIARRAGEAWRRGATEICMQGGIHPAYRGETYLDILKAAKRGAPNIHVHAFSPLEIQSGAATLGISLSEYLLELKANGLGSLPGTAAEILDDSVRSKLCPDKLDTGQWLEVVRTAHELGIPTTSTIMFGHVDDYRSWAKHLVALKKLQLETAGFTEFVPLPFVALESPIYKRGQSRCGPTFRESVLMHAVSRLVFGATLRNVQTSWVKMGVAGGQFCLNSGANDFGGTLMNESITRAAGAQHGQEMTPEHFEDAIHQIGRIPSQRTTLYKPIDRFRQDVGDCSMPLEALNFSDARQR